MTAPLPPHAQLESRRIPGWLFAAGLSLLLALLIVLPFFWRGSASGHDFEFHAASWFDAAHQWKEGTIYPRWAAWTNHGFYAVNADALLITYIRSDFAEQLACAIFPLLFLAALRLCELLDEEARPRSASIALFAMPFAAIWSRWRGSSSR